MADTGSSKHLERDYTGGRILGSTPHRGTTGNARVDQLVTELVKEWRVGENAALIEEMITTALNIGHDDISQGDLKLLNRSLKEMRTANNVFASYEHRRKVTVYGSARTDPSAPEFQAAETFSRRMREHGFMTITGAGDGIMGAANAGAGRADSFGLNIALPFEQDANDCIRGDLKLIEFNYFFTRKLTFLKEAHAVALFPGGFGTMDECFELLTLMQTGKARILPMVMVDAPGNTYWTSFKTFLEEHLERRGLISPEDFSLFRITDDVDVAVDEIVQFYRNYHSCRYVGDKLVFRLREALTETATEHLSDGFADILAKPGFEQRGALPQERHEAAIYDLPRLICTPRQTKWGRHRELIDAINRADCRPPDG